MESFSEDNVRRSLYRRSRKRTRLWMKAGNGTHVEASKYGSSTVVDKKDKSGIGIAQTGIAVYCRCGTGSSGCCRPANRDRRCPISIPAIQAEDWGWEAEVRNVLCFRYAFRRVFWKGVEYSFAVAGILLSAVMERKPFNEDTICMGKDISIRLSAAKVDFGQPYRVFRKATSGKDCSFFCNPLPEKVIIL